MDTCKICRKALGTNARILTEEETETIFYAFKQHFPIAEEGRIDCLKMKYYMRIQGTNQIL